MGEAALRLALLAVGEAVAVAVAAGVVELFADAVGQVVEPVQFGARTVALGLEQAADFGRIDRLRFGGRTAVRLALVQTLKVVGVAVAAAVEEGAALAVLAVKVPALREVVARADLAVQPARVLI